VIRHSWVGYEVVVFMKLACIQEYIYNSCGQRVVHITHTVCRH
jgi:hypothetical protein